MDKMTNVTNDLKMFSYTIVNFQQINDKMFNIDLCPKFCDKFIEYQAGQYIKIYLDNFEPRFFSIANAPQTDKLIKLHICYNQNSNFLSSLFKHINTFNTLQIEGPYGNCILHQPLTPSIFFIAGGYGIVPFHALIQQVLKSNTKQRVHLYWCAKEQHDFYLDDIFNLLNSEHDNFKYNPILSNCAVSNISWQGLTRVLHSAIFNDHTYMKNNYTYINGPASMVLDTISILKKHGINDECIFTDYQPSFSK